jgi:hypothetical protein
LLLAVLVLTASAWLRGAEYDEQYTLFLTAGIARPDWPETLVAAGTISTLQSGHPTLAGIAHDLRTTDVHPPLYFWALSLWRNVFGPSLFAARLISVVCGVVSLCLVGIIARFFAIPSTTSMLLTLGCYGFVYTNAIARGFAPALMLLLCGITLQIARRPLLAGVCLGAACCCNYLALFVTVAVIAVGSTWIATLTVIPFLALDAWFFAAQHAGRTGQFPPFQIAPGLFRLVQYQTGAVFGGLPIYVDGLLRNVFAALIGALAVGLVFCFARARPFAAGPGIRLILGAAIATPIGLLLLGAIFDNTPIELRYLSFGLPFIALLLAWTWRPVHGQKTSALPACVFAIQIASITGLLCSPRTMQPARATAIAAASLTDDEVVLLPRGNDGVGIVGAFGVEASRSQPLLIIAPNDQIADRIAPFRRVAVAMLAQDKESTATIAMLHAALVPPRWRLVTSGSHLEVYERSDDGE